MDKSYLPLTSTILMLQELCPEEERLKQLEVHVKAGDYFATLATIIGFIEETLAEAETPNRALKEREIALLGEIKKDLKYLHEHYRIEPKKVQ